MSEGIKPDQAIGLEPVVPVRVVDPVSGQRMDAKLGAEQIAYFEEKGYTVTKVLKPPKARVLKKEDGATWTNFMNESGGRDK